MIVLYLTSCPPSLRGDLTKWLMEIATGVYVGRVSARVRDKLWMRVIETAKGGRAVLVFSTNNEQRMDFRIHGETWEPIDFDGLKLMLRPSPARIAAKQAKRADGKKLGFSNASKFQRAKRISKMDAKSNNAAVCNSTEVQETEMARSYVVVDIETTGLEPLRSEITEVGAIKVVDGKVVDVFQSFIRIEKSVPQAIAKITGITDEMLEREGRPLVDVMKNLLEFMGDLPLVAHNMPFDLSFLDVAFDKCELNWFTNKIIDTLALAKKLHKNLKSYKLKELAVYFELKFEKSEQDDCRLHRSLGDCYMTDLLYKKLIKLDQTGL